MISSREHTSCALRHEVKEYVETHIEPQVLGYERFAISALGPHPARLVDVGGIERHQNLNYKDIH